MHTTPHFITHIHAKIKPVKRSYEPGMKVTYDASSKRVIVAFRGRISVLPDAYESEAQGTAAGEFHCRTLGWNPQARPHQARPFRALF